MYYYTKGGGRNESPSGKKVTVASGSAVKIQVARTQQGETQVNFIVNGSLEATLNADNLKGKNVCAGICVLGQEGEVSLIRGPGVSCGVCRTHLVVGPWYECKKRPNYNICAFCYGMTSRLDAFDEHTSPK